MIGFGIDRARGLFFDRALVKEKVNQAERRNLSGFGARVRTRSQSSMLGHQVRKGFGAKSKVSNRIGSSPPGQPPTPHTGLLVKFIFFVFEFSRGVASVIIGPIRLNRIGSAPKALEHGGPSVTMTGPRSKRVQRRINIRPRPYMQPAFEQELKKVPGDWKDTVR